MRLACRACLPRPPRLQVASWLTSQMTRRRCRRRLLLPSQGASRRGAGRASRGCGHPPHRASGGVGERRQPWSARTARPQCAPPPPPSSGRPSHHRQGRPRTPRAPRAPRVSHSHRSLRSHRHRRRPGLRVGWPARAEGTQSRARDGQTATAAPPPSRPPGEHARASTARGGAPHCGRGHR